MEKTGNLLVGKVLIDTYLHDNPLLSMQSKILMLNEIIYSKYENEVLGKEVKFPAKERRELDKKYKTYFGKDDWKGSVYDFYRDFLLSQKEKEYDNKRIGRNISGSNINDTNTERSRAQRRYSQSAQLYQTERVGTVH